MKKRKIESDQNINASGGDFEKYVLGLPGYYLAKVHTVPSVKFLLAADGSLGVDFVGSFEHIVRDWGRVLAHLRRISGQPLKNGELPHHNSSDHDHWREVFTPTMRDVIRDLYRDDLTTFVYAI